MTNTIQGYSVSSYGDMITNPRIDPYVQALKASIKPGSVVLEIGTGTGFLAVLACQFGAKKVYAIEPDDAILVARQVAIDNHCADQIEFIQSLSTQVTLPEAADVMISDLRGALPLYQHHIGVIADARQRLMAPGGIQIPQQDTLWVTLVSDAERYQKDYLSPWEDSPYGCILTANRKFVTNTWKKTRLKAEQCFVEPKIWATLDYTTINHPNVKSTLNWTADQAGTIHGIGAWFDTCLTSNIGFSNAPDQPEYIYGNAFFPLSAPIDLVRGDRISLTLQANLIGDDYIWTWQTQVISGDNSSQIKANFQQSTFAGVPITSQSLQKQSDCHIPTLNESGILDRLILEWMDDVTPLGEIATRVTHQFPHRFPSLKEALSYVGNLSEKYS